MAHAGMSGLPHIGLGGVGETPERCAGGEGKSGQAEMLELK